MNFKNTQHNYGLISILIHWLMALAIIGLFALGLWMTSLTYYDPWYKQGPFIHKSIGILVGILLLFRLLWRSLNQRPADADSLKNWEKKTAHIVHGLLYGLLFAIIISGYLISTADGRAIEVFNWFNIPALFPSFENQEDLSGEVHEILAYILIGLVILHAAAALKHHFIDKDSTLKKMLGINSKGE